MKKYNGQVSWVLAFVFCCLAFPMQAGFAQAANIAQGGVFDSYAIQPDARLEIPVEVRDVQDLYAIDIEIRFDPAVIQFEDANPNAEGVQPALGTFLDVGMALYNTIDNTHGVIQFVMTQVNPSEGKTGSGVVLVLYAIGVAEGESPLTVSFLEMSNRAGEAIVVEPVSAVVTVASDAKENESTPIAVQDSSGMIAVPTLGPTEAPAVEANDTDEDAVSQTDQEAEAAVDKTTIEVEEESSLKTNDEAKAGFSLVRYWWVVTLFAAAAIGLGVYLLATKK